MLFMNAVVFLSSWYICYVIWKMLLFVRADMFGSAKVTLERPNPAQVSHITHHSLQLHWEEALAAASAVVGVQSADNRVLVTVQQLSPGGVEEWHEVYKYDYWLFFSTV